MSFRIEGAPGVVLTDLTDVLRELCQLGLIADLTATARDSDAATIRRAKRLETQRKEVENFSKASNHICIRRSRETRVTQKVVHYRRLDPKAENWRHGLLQSILKRTLDIEYQDGIIFLQDWESRLTNVQGNDELMPTD